MKKKLYIFCSAGMSSSTIAKKMQESATEQSLEVEVRYFPESQMNDKAQEADIILLSPQVKYLEAKVREKYSNKVVYLIEMMDYGLLKASDILKKCLNAT